MSFPADQTYKALTNKSDTLLESVVGWIACNAPYTGTEKGYEYFMKVLRSASVVRDNGTRIPKSVVEYLRTALYLRVTVRNEKERDAESELADEEEDETDEERRLVTKIAEALAILDAVHEKQPTVTDENSTSIEGGSPVPSALAELDADLNSGFETDDASGKSEDEQDRSALVPDSSLNPAIRPYTQGFVPLEFGDMSDRGRLAGVDIEAYNDWKVECRRNNGDAGP
ncbi:MAG: hypothetical protein Q9226_008972 [Calogaya cf. arnoldii]